MQPVMRNDEQTLHEHARVGGGDPNTDRERTDPPHHGGWRGGGGLARTAAMPPACCHGVSALFWAEHAGRALQSSQNEGGNSQTCNAIGLGDTCCLTLTMLTMPFMLTFFLGYSIFAFIFAIFGLKRSAIVFIED